MSTKSFRKTKGEFLLISPWKQRVNVTNSLRKLKGKLSPYYSRESNGKCYKLPQKNKRGKISPYYPRESNGKCYKLPQKNKRGKISPYYLRGNKEEERSTFVPGPSGESRTVGGTSLHRIPLATEFTEGIAFYPLLISFLELF